MGSARVRSTVAMVATHCVGDHSFTLAIVYLVLIVVYFAKSPGGFGTLGQVTQLFQNSWLLLAGWIHYLAFDLFLGAWQARQAQRLGISHFLVVPCLLLTFYLAPSVYLCFGPFVLW